MKFYLDFKDKRLPFVEDYLKLNGYETDIFSEVNISKIKDNDVIVLPPAFKWNEILVNKMPRNITIFGGAISQEFEQIFINKKVKYINFMKDEDFVLKNATLTAEGMLCDLILNTKTSMYDSNILILGSGRVAKAVGYLFYKLGLNFDFAMRNEKEFNHSKLFARKCFLGDSYKKELKNYDVVINTIPVALFCQNDESKFKKDSYVFELASKQCLEGVQIKNFNYILCPALPSKYTPESAGKLMVEVINNFLTKGE